MNPPLPSKHRFVLGLAAVLFSLSHAPMLRASSSLLADDRLLLVEGRTAITSSHSRRVGFPGITFHTHFRGTELRMKVNASTSDVWFDVQIDNGPVQRVQTKPGEQELVLAKSLPAAEHRAEITRRTESWQGVCEIFDFAVDPAGEFLVPEPLPVRRLLFIGDSVTCGAGADFQSGLAANPDTSSARRSFGFVLSRRLHAQCHLVSCGGRGLFRDWQGAKDRVNAPEFYEYALPDEPSLLWDHRSYIPDAVVVALGTNDFSQGIPDTNEFINAYVELLRKIRRDAPDAVVILTDSPIVIDSEGGLPKRSALNGTLDEVVKRLNSSKVLHAHVSHYPGIPNNGHPTGAEHVLIADELEPVLRQALGWN